MRLRAQHRPSGPPDTPVFVKPPNGKHKKAHNHQARPSGTLELIVEYGASYTSPGGSFCSVSPRARYLALSHLLELFLSAKSPFRYDSGSSLDSAVIVILSPLLISSASPHQLFFSLLALNGWALARDRPDEPNRVEWLNRWYVPWNAGWLPESLRFLWGMIFFFFPSRHFDNQTKALVQSPRLFFRSSNHLEVSNGFVSMCRSDHDFPVLFRVPVAIHASTCIDCPTRAMRISAHFHKCSTHPLSPYVRSVAFLSLSFFNSAFQ